MLTLKINGQAVDLYQDTAIDINLSIRDASQLDIARTGFSRSLSLPRTALNSRIFRYPEIPNDIAKFNNGSNSAVVICDGATVFEGAAYLDSCTLERKEAIVIYLIGAGCKWIAQAAKQYLRNLPVDYTAEMNGKEISRSWSGDTPVRFLPVHRRNMDHRSGLKRGSESYRNLSMKDYHPFINVRELLNCFFRKEGYSLRSDFMSGDYFGKLYISGHYPSRPTGTLRDAMDFLAGRLETVSVYADVSGRVYATPFLSYSSIGNIVDSADPLETVTAGLFLEGVFTNNNCFRKKDGVICFEPTEAVSVGFIYNINYATTYRIKSREELKGINTVDLGDGITRKVYLKNTFADRKNELSSDTTYLMIVFDHDSASSYMMRYYETSSIGSTVRWTEEFSARTTSFVIFTEHQILNTSLWVKRDGATYYVQYSGDWAVYDSHVRETGLMEVEFNVRTDCERITPGKPKYFNNIVFSGGEFASTFRIYNTTTLRPVFSNEPYSGQTLTYPDIAPGTVTVLNLIKGIQQMFNLCFYTDEASGTVIIEPSDNFFRTGHITDWSEKVDFSMPVKITAPPANDKLGYRLAYRSSTDAAVQEWNEENSDEFGSWASYSEEGNMEETSVYTNTIFIPSLSSPNNFSDAPQAWLIDAGKTGSSDDGSEMNIGNRIVMYAGLVELGGVQKWEWPSYGKEFPLVAFHHPPGKYLPDPNMGDPLDPFNLYRYGFTLSFAQTDGVEGLKSYYTNDLKLKSEGKIIELYLNLGPADIERLQSPDGTHNDMRSLYRLIMDGEPVICRLVEIAGYNPGTGLPTKCKFQIIN